MTSPTQIGLRRGFCSLALVACVTMFTPQPTAARGGSGDACVRWTQKHLVIGNDLQSRRFVLEPKDGLEEMPVFRVAEGPQHLPQAVQPVARCWRQGGDIRQ